MNKAFRVDLRQLKNSACCAKTFGCCRFVYNRMLEIKPCIMTPLVSRYTSLSNTKLSLSG
ncbi:MAG: helix-turn-helix domain-containing protein [Christensenellaceae bacterium]|nr:helix-turn-helix domain-containing protein [Christensenellaceae bacterium]